MNAPHPVPSPPTIEMTLEGEVLPAPTPWRRLAGLWRALPRGSVPLIGLGLLAALTFAVLLLGALLVAIPLLLLAALVSAFGRGPRRSRR